MAGLAARVNAPKGKAKALMHRQEQQQISSNGHDGASGWQRWAALPQEHCSKTYDLSVKFSH
jgi:hypothetical protein